MVSVGVGLFLILAIVVASAFALPRARAFAQEISGTTGKRNNQMPEVEFVTSSPQITGISQAKTVQRLLGKQKRGMKGLRFGGRDLTILQTGGQTRG